MPGEQVLQLDEGIDVGLSACSGTRPEDGRRAKEAPLRR